MIFQESAVVVPRILETAVVDCGELPAEDYSERAVEVEVNDSKPVVMAEECNGRSEAEAMSIRCTVEVVMVEEVGIDSDKSEVEVSAVAVVSVVVEVMSNAVVVVSCSSRVGVKIEAVTVSEAVVEEAGERNKLEFEVVVMEMAAVGSMLAAEVAVMVKENMMAAVVMEECNLWVAVVMSSMMAVAVMECNL
uniref:Uncharacterized protein n=1 Tax=Noccaea caerulescens TaxID=107243 RepID=A0A1J3H1A5_NOCCA